MLWVNLALAAVVVGWAARRLRRYTRLFASHHLVEIARQVHHVSRAGAAWARADDHEGGPLPPHFRTPAGLNVVYTRQAKGPAVDHHLSLSHRDGALAGAPQLVAFLLDVLGVDLDRAHVSAPRLVVHVTFRLIGAEQQVFDQRPVPVLDASTASARFARARTRAREIQLAAG